MANLANKYRPTKFEDVTEQSIVIDILSKMCKSERLENRNFLLIGPAGTGKAQPLYSKVLTPFGFKQMGAIRKGDLVITHTNKLAEVLEIYPQGERDIYEIRLSDNSKFRVADNHINVVSNYSDGRSRYTMDTTKLIKTVYAGINIYIPTFILNHGLMHDIPNLEVYAESIANRLFNKYCRNTHAYIDEFKLDRSIESKLIDRGRITDRIMLADISVREALLSAMKHVCKLNGRYDENDTAYIKHITTPAFADSLVDLANSCGYLAVQKEINFEYEVAITFKKQHARQIKEIKYIGKERCQCIYLDHIDHTYITDNFTITHNTTTARIIDNVLNEGKGEPIELDAASNGGVDNVRQIIEQARSYPVGFKYKVFILDEVHAFSNNAWQALLKTLESSPAKSIFVLCTTNPEKIPATILSRVQTFQLSKISLDGIVNRLKYVLDQEIKEGRNITYTDSAISFIAKLAKGGMRDSLTLLDKALAYSEDINDQNIAKALNLPHYDDFFDLLSACNKKDNTEITKIVSNVYNSGLNFVKWFEEFHSFVMNVVKFIFIQNIDETMIPSYYLTKISKYSTPHAIVCMKLGNKLLEMNAKLKTTQYLEETALTYLCSTERR